VAHEGRKQMTPIERRIGDGVVRVVSMGLLVDDEETALMWRGLMLNRGVQHFLQDVRWGDDLDYLLIDMPPGTGDIAISLSQYLPRGEVFVVTTPQPAAQKVARLAAAMALKVNLPVRGVIENMSWFTGDDGKRYELFGAGGGQELATRLGVPLIAQVPLVPELRAGADAGSPIVASDPDGEAGRVFARIAETIDVELAPRRIYRSELRIS
jgi:ATP-binding protein involved in chromosome partitioning